MGAVEVVEIDNADPRFYPWLGPFLGSREVHAELGGPVYDDPGKRWWVARSGDKVVGFCALHVEGPTVKLGSAYVIPSARDEGVYSALFEARLEAAAALGLKMRAVVRPDAKKLFVRHHFVAVRDTTNYTIFEREPKAAPKKKKGKK